jgi:hypothetical protein
MSGLDEIIQRFTARQHGLIARWQALEAGTTVAALDQRVRRGQLVAVYPTVYRHPAAPFRQDTRWLAAVLAGGDGATLSHQAAAAKHGLGLQRVRPVVSTPHRRHPEVPGITFHRTRRHNDVIVVDKIPITTKPRTLLDCAAVLPYVVFEELLQNAVTGGLVPLESMLAIVDRRGGRGVPGTTATRTALAGGLVDEKIQKRLELIVARIVASAAVPRPVRQHELVCIDGRQVFLDNAWPDRKVAVEGDGRRWHGNRAQAAKTRARSRSIVASGWDHYVYGWSEVTETPDDVRREVEQIVLGPSTQRRAG